MALIGFRLVSVSPKDFSSDFLMFSTSKTLTVRVPRSSSSSREDVAEDLVQLLDVVALSISDVTFSMPN